MALSVSPLHPMFGVSVSGVDFLDSNDAQTTTISRAIDRHGLVLIRCLTIEDEALERFASRFGTLQNMSGSPGVERHIIRVSNVAEDGSIKSANEMTRLQHEANLLWHTDSSFLSPGASYSFLGARIVTREGGYTEFCDTRIAWDALSPERQRQLGSLHAEHSMMHSWRLTGVDMNAVTAISLPSVQRLLAPVHKPTGRRALMVPSHVARIEGMSGAETSMLLAELTAAATSSERVYSHQWRPGDLLIWDNRCMLHRVTSYRGLEEPRDLRSCRVIDAQDASSIVREAA